MLWLREMAQSVTADLFCYFAADLGPLVSTNRDEGSYQLPHIYDYLLSDTATPGGQSFR